MATPSSIPSSRSLHASGGEVRARHPQTLLRLTGKMAPGAHATILASLRPETRATLDGALPMAWIPVEIDVEVMDAFYRELDGAVSLGETPKPPLAAHSIIHARQREEMGSALFDTFVKMALRVLDASPSTVVKRIPSGWHQLFRDVGVVEVVRTSQRAADVRFRGFPPVCMASHAWIDALPVGLHMLYELVNATGTVTCEIEDLAQGNVIALFRWK
jgi:hypothetical protein